MQISLIGNPIVVGVSANGFLFECVCVCACLCARTCPVVYCATLPSLLDRWDPELSRIGNRKWMDDGRIINEAIAGSCRAHC